LFGTSNRFAVSKRIVIAGSLIERSSVLRFTLSKSLSLLSLLLLSFVTTLSQDSAKSSKVVVASLPKAVGDFRLQETSSPNSHAKDFALEDFGIQSEAIGTYVSAKGEKLGVWVARTRSHAGAYALLTRIAAKIRGAEQQSQAAKLSEVGTAGVAGSSHVAFYQGTTFVSITGSPTPGSTDNRVAFARAYAQTLEAADKQIPVLVKHLPEWETAQDRAVYALNLRTLQESAGQQPVLDAVTFDAGAEAVTALYDKSRLVIVEHTTPQLSSSDDERISARISELQAQGQPVPSLYRRVGNYAVFVFNAPDETAAAQLIDQVKYEQSVQWLGENPYAWDYANRRYTRSAVSLLVGTAKVIGFFVVLCLGAGLIFGGMVFMRRRTQQTAMEIYSDAGGMLRLNLDEITPETERSRLLGSGSKKPVA
jgi:hypothetical protein